MKKIVVIAIIIVAAIAVFAVVAGQTDTFFKSAEPAKPAFEKKVEPEDLKKDAKIPVKAMKMQKVKLIDKEKLRESLKKKKEKQGQNPNKTLNFPKKRESCGE